LAKILVVDDDFEILDLVRVSLQSVGHDVTGLSDGKSAEEKVKSEPFDLLLLDVMMPGMDGYHLASSVRSMHIKQPKIVLLTSRDFEKDKLAVIASEVNSFVSKPFDINELIEVIHRQLSDREDDPCKLGSASPVSF